MHTIVLTECWFEKCKKDEYAAIPYLITNSSFWRIGKDHKNVIINDWKSKTFNTHLKKWLRITLKKRGEGLFQDLIVEQHNEKNLYLNLVNAIGSAPKYLCYGDQLLYEKEIVNGGSTIDIVMSEAILKKEGKIFKEWFDKNPPISGDTYYVQRANAVGRNAQSNNKNKDEEFS